MTTLTLSNGTQVQQIPAGDNVMNIRVLPDDREMTDAEWDEYVELVREQQRQAYLIAKYGPFAARRVEARRRGRKAVQS